MEMDELAIFKENDKLTEQQRIELQSQVELA